jgi:hypothetical protein
MYITVLWLTTQSILLFAVIVILGSLMLIVRCHVIGQLRRCLFSQLSIIHATLVLPGVVVSSGFNVENSTVHSRRITQWLFFVE